MSFISFDFFAFITVFLVIYWSLRHHLKQQNLFILISNYVFYGWWDYRFLLLIFLCAMFDYVVGLCMYNAQGRRRKLFIAASLTLNLGVLFFFKYFNFFIESTQSLLSYAGVHPHLHTLHILLPIGLSFFTFQTLSYTIDIYKGKLKPTTDLVTFLNFTSFFPQLLAGPIERAHQLMPQLSKKRVFDYEQATGGIKQICYGVFKKVVIADHLDLRVSAIFANYRHASSPELLLGLMFFMIQLYTDFSGYSDIAIGVGKLLGFKLTTNFRTPFFAKTIPEFWARWHISLTSWFRDYVFMPMLNKNKTDTAWRIFCTTFLLVAIGIWHGAGLSFILFGVVHAIYFLPGIISKKIPWLKKILTRLKTKEQWKLPSIMGTFLLLALSAVFFRAPDAATAFAYTGRMFSFSSLALPGMYFLKWVPVVLIFLIYEWFQQKNDYQFYISHYPKLVRVSLEFSIVFAILLFGYLGKAPFYYFKF